MVKQTQHTRMVNLVEKIYIKLAGLPEDLRSEALARSITLACTCKDGELEEILCLADEALEGNRDE